MPGKKRRDKKDDKARPVVVDDFIYDTPEDPDEDTSAIRSESPDEALRRLRGAHSRSAVDNGASPDSPDLSDPADTDASSTRVKKKKRTSAIVLDDNLQPLRSSGKLHSHPVLRGFLLSAFTLFLIVLIAVYILNRVLPNTRGLDVPEKAVSTVMTPVQSFFSGITDSIADYFRSMKLRSNIEAEYNAVVAENEQLVYKAMLADELQHTLSQYQDLTDEIEANRNMQPIVCTVIGKSDGNYFSTLSINKGSADGIEKYMAVTISGALIGYTETVEPHESTVRTIIDSNASIAALIQSSRDQGTVRGTLGIDGTPMCRMYYLPDDNLPRPGDLVVTSGVGMKFPKGIPIGTVRESTRGMESNKQYIVLEPKADFQHLEYVIVLRYKPEAEAIEGRENGWTNIPLVPLESARPSPEIPQIAASLFDTVNTTDSPDASSSPSVSPTPTETPTPTPSPTPTPTPAPTPDATSFEYQVVNLNNEPTPTPTPTIPPTPTPYLPPDPAEMTFEEEE